MSLPALAMLLTGLVHVVGAGILVWALMDGERVDWRGILRPGDDWGGGPRRGPRPDAPPPLPDAEQSSERFREPGRLADRKASPPRRAPAEPQREREPGRV